MARLGLVAELVFVVLFAIALRDYLARREAPRRKVALMLGRS